MFWIMSKVIHKPRGQLKGSKVSEKVAEKWPNSSRICSGQTVTENLSNSGQKVAEK